MRPFAGADGADVTAAGVLAIGGAVELHLEADEVAVGRWRRAEYVELRGAHTNLPCAVSAGSGVTVMVSWGTAAYFFDPTRSTLIESPLTTMLLIASIALLQ